jgi:hypothetical protein
MWTCRPQLRSSRKRFTKPQAAPLVNLSKDDTMEQKLQKQVRPQREGATSGTDGMGRGVAKRTVQLNLRAGPSGVHRIARAVLSSGARLNLAPAIASSLRRRTTPDQPEASGRYLGGGKSAVVPPLPSRDRSTHPVGGHGFRATREVKVRPSNPSSGHGCTDSLGATRTSHMLVVGVPFPLQADANGSNQNPGPTSNHLRPG